MSVSNQESRVVFRDATTRDVVSIVALVESAYRGETSRLGWTTEADLLGGQRTDADSVRAALGRSETVILLATFEEEIVGCCQLDRHGARTVHFGMFAVRPELQGAGIGRAVLAEAERAAQQRWSARNMRMTVIRQRDELIAWYRRRGYAATGEIEPFAYGDRRFGIPRRDDLEFLVLEKPLGETSTVDSWGIERYGDPCRECGFRWSITIEEAVAVVDGLPGEIAAVLSGASGAERHPDLTWSVSSYVCHVSDNLRIWAERLAGVRAGGPAVVGAYDENLLGEARGYATVSLDAAMWSLGRSVSDWLDTVASSRRVDSDVVLVHPERGALGLGDVVAANAHDGWHHKWDIERSLRVHGI